VSVQGQTSGNVTRARPRILGRLTKGTRICPREQVGEFAGQAPVLPRPVSHQAPGIKIVACQLSLRRAS
jgi:hypothetical protein